MPNLWTHLLFGQHVLKEMEATELISPPDLAQLFQFACQGPDFLLYHNFFPWTKDKRVAEFGELMHKQHCGLFLLEMIKYVDKHRTAGKLANHIVSYTLGFISHYVLDRHMHPYVYYRSGYAEWQHQRFEVMMDTLILKKLKGLETWRTPAWKQIYLGRQLPADVVEMLSEVTKQVYPDLSSTPSPDEWQTAYRHMCLAHRIFHDPTGLKRIATLGQIDPLVYKRQVPSVDILNETRATWYHPCNQEEAYNYSVWDLWELALENTRDIYQQVLDLLNEEGNEDREERFAALSISLGNYSYDTGKSCGEDLPLKYAEPII